MPNSHTIRRQQRLTSRSREAWKRGGEPDSHRPTADRAGSSKVVKIIHETVGVPMKFFPHLAVCEIAGALGLIIGIWSPPLGVTAGSGLVTYFIGAIVSHLRVGDFKGIGAAAFMFGLSVASVALRIATI